jgi:hypothetical protein
LKLYWNKDYAKCVETFEYGGVADSFKVQNGKDFVSFNFIKRDLSYIFDTLEKDTFFDITTPFDYGGFEYSNKDLLEIFFKEFTLFCEKNNIISSFIRFAPTYIFDVESVSKFMNIKKINDLIFIDLETDFWNNYSRGRKSNLNKINKLEFKINIIEIEKFYNLYLESMNRNNANKYFYFDKAILQNLVSSGFARVFGIFLEDRLISSIMILDEIDCSYYFLGASLTEKLSLDANAMLFHQISLLLQKEGQKKFFLGGGRAGVYEFKRRFSSSTLPYYIGMKIYNIDMYNKLVQLSQNQDNDFFPKYREKII